MHANVVFTSTPASMHSCMCIQTCSHTKANRCGYSTPGHLEHLDYNEHVLFYNDHATRYSRREKDPFSRVQTPPREVEKTFFSTSRFVAYATLVMWKRVLLGPRGKILYLIMTIICNTYVIWQVAIRPQASLNTLVIMRILVTITACCNM